MIEHVYPLIRSRAPLERAVAGIEASPGLVLFTLVDEELTGRLEQACEEIGSPCLSVLEPILGLFQSYLGQPFTPKPGAQHVLHADYFKRIDALNFTMAHDDGQIADGYDRADVLLLGVSRTSKTPTSIYLANRGVRTANIPLVPNLPLDPAVLRLKQPLIVGLIASPERIVQIRQNRLLTLNADQETPYVDKVAVTEELAYSRRLFAQNPARPARSCGCADHRGRGWNRRTGGRTAPARGRCGACRDRDPSGTGQGRCSQP